MKTTAAFSPKDSGANVETKSTRVASAAHKKTWPRPPSCIVAADLGAPPDNARICVAGLVILRQRPGTAKGVIFLTLEDETGVVNVIVWRKIYEEFRRAVIAGRLLRATGRIQRSDGVMHLIAEQIEDISPMLDCLLAEQGRAGDPAFAVPNEMG